MRPCFAGGADEAGQSVVALGEVALLLGRLRHGAETALVELFARRGAHLLGSFAAVMDRPDVEIHLEGGATSGAGTCSTEGS